MPQIESSSFLTNRRVTLTSLQVPCSRNRHRCYANAQSARSRVGDARANKGNIEAYGCQPVTAWKKGYLAGEPPPAQCYTKASVCQNRQTMPRKASGGVKKRVPRKLDDISYKAKPPPADSIYNIQDSLTGDRPYSCEEKQFWTEFRCMCVFGPLPRHIREKISTS